MDTERVFHKTLRALGGRRQQRSSALGGRSILVPAKSPYPLSGAPMGGGGRVPRQRGYSKAAERRRRNLTYLAVFIIATFLIGVIPGMRFMLVINLIADVLLILYLGLALYLAIRPPLSEREPMDPQPMTEAPAPPPAVEGAGF